MKHKNVDIFDYIHFFALMIGLSVMAHTFYSVLNWIAKHI